MELRDNYTLSTIDNKRTRLCHIRDVAQEDILHNCAEVLMVGIRTRELKLGLKWHAIG